LDDTARREPGPAPRSTRDRDPPGYYRFGVILGALAALGPLAIDMYLPAFPAIGRDLGADASHVEVTVSTYFLGLTLGQLVYGPISDRVGRKRPLYLGLAVFAAASVGCAFAGGIEALIGLRFLQALGGCVSMMIARAVVRDAFDDAHSARVLSLLMLVMGLAPILAPMIGGWILGVAGWRWIFDLLAVYALLCLAAVVFLLPETLPPARRQRHGLWRVLATYAELLRDRPFMANALAGSFVMAGMFAYIAGSPFVFIEVFGVDPSRYGYFFGANALGIMAAAQLTGRLAPRLGPARLFRSALVVVAAAGILLAIDGLTGFGGFAGILVPLFVFVASVGCVMPLSTVLAMAAQGSRAGSASALMGTIQFGLGALAGALVGAFNNGTPASMVLVIAGCGVAALLAPIVARGRRSLSG
jgi:DHA1 family bicyclomycin/chloramphenicol resistance-like MFS transporter